MQRYDYFSYLCTQSETEMIDSSILQGKKAAFFTLGCKLNFAETSTVAQQLARYGVTKTAKGEVADIVVVNTCSVTEVADHKCRQAIHRLVKQHPGAFVVVTGCYAQLKPQEIIATDGVDLVLGSEQKANLIPAILNGMTNNPHGLPPHDGGGSGRGSWSFSPACSRGDRTRYFLKVQDGCNYFCTYCTIPMARGRSRNGSIASLVEQAQQVAQEGGKEIVITGVNIGDFGRTTGETFFDLVKALDGVEGIERYRISSIEPNLLTDEMIRFIAASRAFLPHFHIPLQAGSDHVLQMMHRRYDTALYRDKLLYIKQLMPDACIAADVMAGFNGESEEEFAKVLQYIESLPISYLHVFTYSDRPGTAALRMGEKVPVPVRREHTARLLELSERKHHAFVQSQLGQRRPVLWESSRHGASMLGWTDNYIRVARPYEPALVGTIEQVTLAADNIVDTDL